MSGFFNWTSEDDLFFLVLSFDILFFFSRLNFETLHLDFVLVLLVFFFKKKNFLNLYQKY